MSIFSPDVGCSYTVNFDKNGYFSKFKARWVCRGFQDKFAWDQQTDSPTATRYGFRLVAQCAANHYWDLFHLDLKTAFLQEEHYNLSSRMVVVQLPPDIGLPTWMVGLCLRPVYGLNDAPRRRWNRLDKFLRTVGMEPTRADRCTYVAYDGIEGKKGKSYVAPGGFSQEKEPGLKRWNLFTLRSLPFMPCHAMHMMKEVVLPPTVQRRDPIFLVQISHNVSTPILRRRWLTMLGDLLPMRNSLDSWAVSRVRERLVPL